VDGDAEGLALELRARDLGDHRLEIPLRDVQVGKVLAGLLVARSVRPHDVETVTPGVRETLEPDQARTSSRPRPLTIARGQRTDSPASSLRVSGESRASSGRSTTGESTLS
jgi:hypothetical protein